MGESPRAVALIVAVLWVVALASLLWARTPMLKNGSDAFTAVPVGVLDLSMSGALFASGGAMVPQGRAPFDAHEASFGRDPKAR